MAKVMTIIRSKGIFKNKETNQDVAYDNYLFYMTSGERLFGNEELIVGEGKPTTVKIKVSDLEQVYKDDVKMLFGKDVRFFTENGKLAEIKIK